MPPRHEGDKVGACRTLKRLNLIFLQFNMCTIIHIIIFHSAVSTLETSVSGLDGLIMELEKLKSYLNNVELQLYEANEHNSDLLEKVRKFKIISLTFFVFVVVMFRIFWNFNEKILITIKFFLIYFHRNKIWKLTILP